MAALTVILAALATYRLTRLVTADVIAEPVRQWVGKRNQTLGYLVTCDWCLSIWVAPWPALVVVVWPGNRAVLVVLTALALSAVTGLLATIEQRMSND